MKNLIVFYSLEGHTRYIADKLAKQISADIVELKPRREIPKSGFGKYLLGGMSVIFKQKPELINAMPNMDQYDAIFIGTPVWAGTYCASVNTLLAKYPFSGKKTALFACNAGGGAKKCFERLKKRLVNNKVIGEIEFIDPSTEKANEVDGQLKNWISALGMK